jgi:hypothetical protein
MICIHQDQKNAFIRIVLSMEALNLTAIVEVVIITYMVLKSRFVNKKIALIWLLVDVKDFV